MNNRGVQPKARGIRLKRHYKAREKQDKEGTGAKNDQEGT